MIGRGSQGNPWIFRDIAEYFATGTIPARPSPAEVKAMIWEHAALQLAVKGEYIGIREMRKHTAWYLAGFPHAAKLRKQACEMESMEDLEKLLACIEEG